MGKPINTDDLTRAAVEYDNTLRALPYYKFNEIAKKLRIRILSVNGEDIIVNKRRKSGILKPYSVGLPLNNEQEIMKFYESKLKPELTFAEIVDNINNYKDKKVISNQGEMVNNKTKEHPLKFLILKDLVISYSEDVIFNMFFAERDISVLSPATSFNGFNTKIDMLIAAGEISEAKRNLKPTGAFADPVDGNDITPYTKLVEFIKSADPMLRNGQALLYASEAPLLKALAGYANKVKSFNDPTLAQMLTKLREDARCPNLDFVTDNALGQGDNLKLMAPGLLDLGVNTEGDEQFVQVRTPYKDPNDVQFWIQAGYDTRIIDIHPKLFLTNEQKNTALNYAGDY